MTNLQHERIAYLCTELHLKAVESVWPGAAQTAVAREASFGDFLEEVLMTKAETRRARAREMAARVAGFPAGLIWHCAGNSPAESERYH